MVLSSAVKVYVRCISTISVLSHCQQGNDIDLTTGFLGLEVDIEDLTPFVVPFKLN